MSKKALFSPKDQSLWPNELKMKIPRPLQSIVKLWFPACSVSPAAQGFFMSRESVSLHSGVRGSSSMCGLQDMGQEPYVGFKVLRAFQKENISTASRSWFSPLDVDQPLPQIHGLYDNLMVTRLV